ncbi:MAG: hypothetical protein ACP5FH_10270, partial [Terracidiphilus sp.]
LLKGGIRGSPPGGCSRDFRCVHPDSVSLIRLGALVECYEGKNKDEMMKLTFVKKPTGKAAFCTCLVLIKSRAIRSRLLAMPVEMDWRLRPGLATNQQPPSTEPGRPQSAAP